MDRPPAAVVGDVDIEAGHWSLSDEAVGVFTQEHEIGKAPVQQFVRSCESWPLCNIPIDGEPSEVVSVVEAYSRWLAESDVPKLFIKAQPGAVVNDRTLQLIRTWPNLTETTVSGIHFVQEDSPDEIGTAVAKFICNSQLSMGTSRRNHKVGMDD